MQDCCQSYDSHAKGHVTIRWCPERHGWIVYAWCRQSPDGPFHDVHPMWDGPRFVADDEHTSGTLSLLLSAVLQSTHTAQMELESGQMTLF